MVRAGGDADTDRRLIEYIEALKISDIDKAIKLRLLHVDDAVLMIRFKTAQATLAGLIDSYIREIQILRLEIEGWKSICEAQDRMAKKDIDKGEILSARQCQYRGLEKVERALRYRKRHTEVDLPKLSRTI
jgi:hypothetical protein